MKRKKGMHTVQAMSVNGSVEYIEGKQSGQIYIYIYVYTISRKYTHVTYQHKLVMPVQSRHHYLPFVCILYGREMQSTIESISFECFT